MTLAANLDDRGKRIFGAILQGALKAGRTVKPSLGARGTQFKGGHGYGVLKLDDEHGPCCAVGAGVLFSREHGVSVSPLDTFAEIHGVSVSFARGVSDGFEGVEHFGAGVRPYYSRFNIGHLNTDDYQAARDDYAAGVKVGEAVFAHYYGGGEVAP